MLRTHLIPLGDGDTEAWSRFLDKAMRRSYKALDWLHQAMQTFMVDVTGDPDSPSTLNMEAFFTEPSDWFPADFPLQDIDEFREMAIANGWATEYRVVGRWWKRATTHRGILGYLLPAPDYSLLDRAMLLCARKWSGRHMYECLNHFDYNYSSIQVVCGMLYLSLLWSEQNGAAVL